ncbi:MAG: LacI family DNA-binding transcriptional regulator [Pseudomonadota bacterium]
MQKDPRIRPKLDDVAARAGVSTATVSRCLSAPQKVRPAVRQRVEAAIAELGYRPHGAARALASRRSHTVGAVIPTLDNAIFATVVQTLQRGLAAAGRTLLLAASDYDQERERAQIENLVVRGVDGLMLTGEARDPALFELLARRGIRYVNTYVHHPGSPHPSIGFDNRRAMEKLIAYLYDLGHRRFAMIAGIAEASDRAGERIEGTQAALKKRRLKLVPEGLIARPYTIADGRAALRHLMALAPRPTAVVCGNDVLALGALLEAPTLGLRVPRDLSITGFDDLDLAREVPPGLTTVHAPLEQMGRLTADYLVGAEPPGDAPHHVELPAELVVRGSSGAAPKG